MNTHEKYGHNVSRVLLLGFGLIFILAALIYNEFLLILFDPHPPIDVETLTNIRRVQIRFLIIGLALIVASEGVIRRISWLDSIVRKDSVTNILLATLPVLTLVIILEFSLQPFAKTSEATTIFIRDR
jgi:hypothetical protein